MYCVDWLVKQSVKHHTGFILMLFAKEPFFKTGVLRVHICPNTVIVRKSELYSTVAPSVPEGFGLAAETHKSHKRRKIDQAT